MKKLIILVAVLLTSGCSTLVYDDGIKNAYKFAAQNAVEKRLGNVQFEDMSIYRDATDHIAVCGITQPDHIFFISNGADVLLSTDLDRAAFRKKWAESCKGATP